MDGTLEKTLGKSGSIPKYRHIFLGVKHADPQVPDNVLLFTRTTFEPEAEHRHQHHRFMLLLNLRADGHVCLDEKLVFFPEGHALCVFPHQFHHYVNSKPPFHWLYVAFDLKSEVFLLPLRDKPLPLSAALLGRVDKIIELFAASFEAGAPEKANHLAFAVGDFLYELLDAARNCPGAAVAAEPSKDLFIVDKVNQFIHENLDKPLGNEALAKMTRLSASHLRFLFRNSFKMSLGNYVRKVRMDKARLLLRDPGLSVEEIAGRLGFGSVFSFSHCFKREEGLPPSEYRRQGGEEHPIPNRE